MSGPKPLSTKKLALRHAVRSNYNLLEVLTDRKFRVACKTCGEDRVVAYKRGNVTPSCVCTNKRRFFRHVRTPETHTAEIRDYGVTDYVCTHIVAARLASKSSVGEYLHKSCGYRFPMLIASFLQSIRHEAEPCNRCKAKRRKDAYVHKLSEATKKIILVGEYKNHHTPTLHQYVKCGHKVKHTPEVASGMRAVKCPVCCPTKMWFRVKVDAKLFKVRSLVEADFLKYIVRERGISVNDVEYEPTDGRVKYKDPFDGKLKTYIPDFKVRGTFVEVKDKASLGLTFYHWQDKKEALEVNRAKYQAAVRHHKDYRVYVRIKGEFHRTRNFWKPSEQTRLTAF